MQGALTRSKRYLTSHPEAIWIDGGEGRRRTPPHCSESSVGATGLFWCRVTMRCAAPAPAAAMRLAVTVVSASFLLRGGGCDAARAPAPAELAPLAAFAPAELAPAPAAHGSVGVRGAATRRAAASAPARARLALGLQRRTRARWSRATAPTSASTQRRASSSGTSGSAQGRTGGPGQCVAGGCRQRRRGGHDCRRRLRSAAPRRGWCCGSAIVPVPGAACGCRSPARYGGGVRGWDTSRVATMAGVFGGQPGFNLARGGWDVAAATNTDHLFALRRKKASPTSCNLRGCRDDDEAAPTAFIQNLARWSVAWVASMRGAFFHCAHFNQPLDSWGVSRVADMESLFSGAVSFNQPLAAWDVAGVTTLRFTRGRGQGRRRQQRSRRRPRAWHEHGRDCAQLRSRWRSDGHRGAATGPRGRHPSKVPSVRQDCPHTCGPDCPHGHCHRAAGPRGRTAATDSSGVMALMFAAHGGHTSTAALLLDRGTPRMRPRPRCSHSWTKMPPPATEVGVVAPPTSVSCRPSKMLWWKDPRGACARSNLNNKTMRRCLDCASVCFFLCAPAKPWAVACKVDVSSIRFNNEWPLGGNAVPRSSARVARRRQKPQQRKCYFLSFILF